MVSLLPSSILGNANKKPYSFLIVAVLMAFLLGLFTSPLLNCSDSCHSPQLPAPALHATPADLPAVREPPSTDQTPSDLMTFPSKCADALSSSDVKRVLLDRIYDGISPFEGFPPEFAKPWLGDIKIMGWGSNDPVFERCITEVKPRIVLELGTFLGASAIHMANVSKAQGREVLILCVDDFRGWPGFRHEFKAELIHADVQLLYQFLRNVQTTGMTESIFPIPFSTTAAMAALCQWGVYADLIEVDAAHDFHSAWTDINFAHALLRPGGVMFGDDYYHPGVGKAVKLFAKVKGFRVEVDGRHWIMRST